MNGFIASDDCGTECDGTLRGSLGCSRRRWPDSGRSWHNQSKTTRTLRHPEDLGSSDTTTWWGTMWRKVASRRQTLQQRLQASLRPCVHVVTCCALTSDLRPHGYLDLWLHGYLDPIPLRCISPRCISPRHNTSFCRLFTARRNPSAVLGAVSVPICLSHACFVTKQKNILPTYHM